MPACITAIEYYLPENRLQNEELAADYPDWPAEKILAKTGIAQRHIAGGEEFSSDLACRAAERLFASGACQAADIDFVLLCTQSPDYFLPTTACLIQHRLGIPKTAGALDFNLGCSGFVYGLSLAKGLIETGQCRNVLLLTAETYSKFIDRSDHGVRTIFGDAAAATLVQDSPEAEPMGPFVFGTDGSGAKNLIVQGSGLRDTACGKQAVLPGKLYMNGPEIFSFTLRAVPAAVKAVLQRAGRTADQVDLFVFHQANEFMLQHLRKSIGIPSERFVIAMRDCGNTVSSTIPIALKEAEAAGQLRLGSKVMLVGFGVGYSWGANLLTWAAGAARQRRASA